MGKGGERIFLLVIHGVQADISPCTIGIFLHRPEYQALVNTEEIDYRMKEMRKITKRTLGFDKKIDFFRLLLSV